MKLFISSFLLLLVVISGIGCQTTPQITNWAGQLTITNLKSPMRGKATDTGYTSEHGTFEIRFPLMPETIMVMDTAMKDYVKKYKVPVKDIAMICDLYYCCTVITAIPGNSVSSLDAIDQKWIDQNLPTDQADKLIKDESVIDQSYGPCRTFLYIPAQPNPKHTFCRLDGFLSTSNMLYHVRVNKVIPMQPSRSQNLASRQSNDMKYAINKVGKTFEVIRKHMILHGMPAKN